MEEEKIPQLTLTPNLDEQALTTEKKEETLENINVIKCVGQTIFNALNLIGVVPPEKM